MRKGHNKYPPALMAEAVKRVGAGESPFRVAEDMGIARTTILYWLEKGNIGAVDAVPVGQAAEDSAKKDGRGNDPAEILKRAIYVTYWRACLKHLTIVSRKTKSADAERSSRILKNLDFKVSAVWSPGAGQRLVPMPVADEDRITFREFIIERKQEKVDGDESPDGGLGEPRLDNPAESEPGADAGEPDVAEEA